MKMEIETFHKDMWDKVVHLEENMGHKEKYESMVYLQEIGEKIKQHPSEFYFCINDLNYKLSVIKKLNPRRDDVVLDIGTGVADFPLMLKDKVNRIYALELHKEIFDLANPYIQPIDNITFINISFQDWNFPKEITKAVMLAWHCSPLTLVALLSKLSRTDCRILVHNFGKANSIQVNIVNKKK